MQIKIKTLTTKIVVIDVEPDYTVKRVKELVQEKEGTFETSCVFCSSNDRNPSRTTTVGIFW
jgi:hypothetical protein